MIDFNKSLLITNLKQNIQFVLFELDEPQIIFISITDIIFLFPDIIFFSFPQTISINFQCDQKPQKKQFYCSILNFVLLKRYQLENSNNISTHSARVVGCRLLFLQVSPVWSCSEFETERVKTTMLNVRMLIRQMHRVGNGDN